jgi:hypothetical protein
VPPPLENVAKGLARWEDLESWITPNDKFFSIAHYNRPQIDDKTWRLGVSGLVEHPSSLTLDQLRALPREQVTFTLECSGNTDNATHPNRVTTRLWHVGRAGVLSSPARTAARQGPQATSGYQLSAVRAALRY